MKEHEVYVAFSAKSFENAFRFGRLVESGDYSHDYGRHMSDDEGGIGYIITKCMAYGDWSTDAVRLEMPGLVLLQYFNQAYAFARGKDGLWHSCWVDEEFSV